MPTAPPVHRPFGKRKPVKASRAGSTSRGYSYRWQQARLRFLRKHPLCIECEASGILTEANEVDHIQPHRGDDALFWDEGNWQPLCKPCHSRKTLSGR